MLFIKKNLNKYCFILLVISLCISSNTVLCQSNELPQKVEQSQATQIFKQAEHTVVLIETYDEKGQIAGRGSGFIVSAEGKIVTNYHVIAHTKKATVKLINGDAYDTVDVIDIDKRKDIALIKIRAVELPFLNLGRSTAIEVGEKIYCLGNPLGALRNTLSEGIISAIRAGDGYKYFQISAPISSGSSGSPVMNTKGEVIGIAFASIEQGQNLNFAIPIDYAKGMLTSNQTQTLASIYEPKEEKPTLDSESKVKEDTKSNKIIKLESLPQELRTNLAGYFQKRINVLTTEDIENLFGKPNKTRVFVSDDNQSFDVFEYVDPNRVFNTIELNFSKLTGKLTNFAIYPYAGRAKIETIKKIFGEDDKKKRVKYNNGNKLYCYPGSRMNVVTDKDDNVLVLGYY